MASFYNSVESSPEPDSVEYEDMLKTAKLFSEVMDKAGIKHGFLGGFACLLIGGTRQTADVDCCVEATWQKLREVLSAEKDFQLPKSKLVSGVMRIYAHVDEDKKVQIDVKQAGEGAGPKSLEGAIMNVNGLPTLNYVELIRAKLRAYSKRDGQWDGEDLIFLIGHVKGKLPTDQISTEEAEYFIENFDWSGRDKEKAAVIKALIP